VLNGQQRLITVTILLSVLRHLASTHFPEERERLVNELKPGCFNFKQGRELRSVSRIQVRKLQSEFWTKHISPAEDNLGCLWNEEGQLRVELAGSDTITRKFMHAAEELKKVSPSGCSTRTVKYAVLALDLVCLPLLLCSCFSSQPAGYL